MLTPLTQSNRYYRYAAMLLMGTAFASSVMNQPFFSQLDNSVTLTPQRNQAAVSAYNQGVDAAQSWPTRKSH